MRDIEIHRQIVNLSGVSIFYMDTLTDGEVILCLHGRWSRAETWVDFIRHYGKKYRIIAPDQRGHGLSDKPDSEYTAEEMSRDMINLLDHLSIESAIIVGHSMGGCIAGYVAAFYPDRVRALAILDKSASGPQANEKAQRVDPITKNWPLPFNSLIEAQEYIRKDIESDLGYQYFMNSLFETVDGYQMMFSPQAMVKNIKNYKSWFEILSEIKCPVMLLRAQGGEAVPDRDFERMKSLIRNCIAFESTNKDHNVQLADKERFYIFFDSFLKRLENEVKT